ncbi:MAG: hypothetical protein CJBNEKGG_01152 [Prosthecobacter sp.]|nr:hypothetical protein [Prosthecobacter sp.]
MERHKLVQAEENSRGEMEVGEDECLGSIHERGRMALPLKLGRGGESASGTALHRPAIQLHHQLCERHMAQQVLFIVQEQPPMHRGFCQPFRHRNLAKECCSSD